MKQTNIKLASSIVTIKRYIVYTMPMSSNRRENIEQIPKDGKYRTQWVNQEELKVKDSKRAFLLYLLTF